MSEPPFFIFSSSSCNCFSKLNSFFFAELFNDSLLRWIIAFTLILSSSSLSFPRASGLFSRRWRSGRELTFIGDVAAGAGAGVSAGVSASLAGALLFHDSTFFVSFTGSGTGSGTGAGAGAGSLFFFGSHFLAGAGAGAGVVVVGSSFLA